MSEGGGEKLIASNPNARADYFLEELVEAGIALQGTEVKSLRMQSPNLKDSYVEISNKKRGEKRAPTLEAWILNFHIAPYSHGNIWNHESKRPRKLLLHRHQIKKMFGALTQDGKTLIPTRVYFSKGRVKVEIAIAKGKKKGDKREDVKKRSQDREMRQAMKQKQRR
ncbi:SsrA-binding protein SmpB [bacterium]|jgi:SsrA-binding protein|nr:SsrA-binding protein SmpB [bacterium]